MHKIFKRSSSLFKQTPRTSAKIYLNKTLKEVEHGANSPHIPSLCRADFEWSKQKSRAVITNIDCFHLEGLVSPIVVQLRGFLE